MKTDHIIFELTNIGLETRSFQIKIPENFKIATGYLITSRIDSLNSNGIFLGNISLNVNSGKTTIVPPSPVFSDKNSLKKRKYAFEPILQLLEGGKYITGYYEGLIDLGATTYNLKIYIKGKVTVD